MLSEGKKEHRQFTTRRQFFVRASTPFQIQGNYKFQSRSKKMNRILAKIHISESFYSTTREKNNVGFQFSRFRRIEKNTKIL